MALRPPTSKYHAKKMEVDGIKFASKSEAHRYLALKGCRDVGLIDDLELQPRFRLLDAFTRNGVKHRAIEYIADFRYIESGRVVVEDVKGMMTPDYKIKRKLLLAKFPDQFVFREVHNQKATDY